MDLPLFPLAVSFGMTGGPSRQTDIFTAQSGREIRNNPHSRSRRRYNAGVGIKSLEDLQLLIAFFEARQGQLLPFLIKDPFDFRTGDPITHQDVPLGVTSKQNRRFALTKPYSDGQNSYSRAIAYPKLDSLAVAINGSAASIDWDAQAGEIELFDVPSDNAQVTAGFEFYTPVRFDTPRLDLTLESFGAGRVVNIPLIEVLGHA